MVWSADLTVDNLRSGNYDCNWQGAVHEIAMRLTVEQ